MITVNTGCRFSHRLKLSSLASSSAYHCSLLLFSICLPSARKVGWKTSLSQVASVWPDWAILGIFGNKFNYKSSPNVLGLFGQLWKPLLFKSNWWCYFLGNFRKNLGYFLFQHLVTLRGINMDVNLLYFLFNFEP